MRRPTSIRPLALLAGLSLALLACAPPAIRVGSDLDHAPFIDTDENGGPIGRDVELMEMMADRMGRELEWVTLPFAELLPALERGDVDVVNATIGITNLRAARFDFGQPNYVTDIRVLVRSGPGEPTSIADLAGRRVAASVGTTSEAALLEVAGTAIVVLRVESDLRPAERLRAGEVDGAVMDGPDAAAYAASSDGALRVLAEPLARERYALVFRKGDDTLRPAFDGALLRMHAGGLVDRLDARYELASWTPEWTLPAPVAPCLSAIEDADSSWLDDLFE